MKATDVKMLPHTFAVGRLIAGVPKENVARMLGHFGTQVIDDCYAPWVQGLDDAHIQKVREIMARSKPRKNLKLVSRQGVRVAAASHFGCPSFDRLALVLSGGHQHAPVVLIVVFHFMPSSDGRR